MTAKIDKIRTATLPVMLDIFRYHESSGNKDLIRMAVEGVCVCSPSSKFKKLMHELGAIKLLVKVMHREASNEHVQHQIMVSIATALQGDDQRLKDSCREDGAIDAILAATNKHKNSQRLMFIAHEALIHVTKDVEVNAEYIKGRMTSKQAARINRSSVKDIIPKDKSELPQRCREWLEAMKLTEEARSKDDDVTAQVAKAYYQEKFGERCVICDKTAEDVSKLRLSRCSACTLGPLYCSTECQKAHWKVHKTECKANRK